MTNRSNWSTQQFHSVLSTYPSASCSTHRRTTVDNHVGQHGSSLRHTSDGESEIKRSRGVLECNLMAQHLGLTVCSTHASFEPVQVKQLPSSLELGVGNRHLAGLLQEFCCDLLLSHVPQAIQVLLDDLEPVRKERYRKLDGKVQKIDNSKYDKYLQSPSQHTYLFVVN